MDPWMGWAMIVEGLLFSMVAALMLTWCALRAVAKQAFDAEMAREKGGDCPGSRSNYDWKLCLGHERDITDRNYEAFAGVIRSTLGLNLSLIHISVAKS